MLSFTALLLEHFFAKPTDVLSAAVSILFLLIPSQPLLVSWGSWYWALLYYEVALVVISTAALLLLSDDSPQSKRNQASEILKALAVGIGDGRAQYFLLASIAIVFFIQPRSAAFVALLLYALMVMAIRPQRAIARLPRLLKARAAEVGEIIAVEGGSSYLVRLHTSSSRPMPKLGSLLEIHYEVDDRHVERNGWIRAACHPSIDKTCSDMPAMASYRRGAVYERGEPDKSGFFDRLFGFVSSGSDIGTLRFVRAGGAPVMEGDLVEVATDTGAVIYQVVNGKVNSETLDKRNLADSVVGEAIQLGKWDGTAGAFIHHGWVPDARTPVTKLSKIVPLSASPDELNLGCIPGTDISVLLNRKDAVSHHTAILGVTGVGKSMFARNLVRELAGEEVRVIVVDFTREWKRKLTGGDIPLIITDTAAKPLREAIRGIESELAKFKNQQNEGVVKAHKKILFDGFVSAIKEFVEGADRVRIFELPDLSNTEGVLEYTQWFFSTLFQLAREGNINNKKICIVLEEAHTVVPEWNFVGIADRTSQSLVNNISQIALQGRKYDIGFIVIAQRTASVSKTVLTQCNTIIAFQCFDGTSLGFLGNYLPPALVGALPNLGFRKAIAVGKAIRSNVPLIFEVPDLSQKEGGVVAPTLPGMSVEASAAIAHGLATPPKL
jgi:uncharacterized protein